MADKHPIKAVFTNGDATALQEFETSDTLGIAHGGTGSTTAAGARTNLLGLAAAPSADTWDGITVTLTAAATTSGALGKVYYINSSGKAALCDNDADSTMPAMYMATAATTADTAAVFLRSGIVHLHTLNPGWTAGQLIYVDGASGDGTLTSTRPSASGKRVQIVGVALAADILDFRPCPVVVQVT
jgi:hypothetical protein